MSKVSKVVLAYSGGLDTSVILKWLQDVYDCEVVCFTADIGQGEELEPARAKAKQMGVKKIYIDDLREAFVGDFVFPMFRANALYEGEYLLGTSIARPLIAKRLVEIARKEKADAIAHGATGKGNDQVRFELGAYALMPGVRIIAPVARMGPDLAREAARVRRPARHPRRLQEAQGRRALLHGREPAAHIL
jgi:argininosuccinate synthase